MCNQKYNKIIELNTRNLLIGTLNYHYHYHGYEWAIVLTNRK